MKIGHEYGEESNLLRDELPKDVITKLDILKRAIDQIAFGKTSLRQLGIKLFSIRQSKDSGYDVGIDFSNSIGGLDHDGKIKKLNLTNIEEDTVNQMYARAINEKTVSEMQDAEKQADLVWCKMNAYNCLLDLLDSVEDNFEEIMKPRFMSQVEIEFECELPEGVTVAPKISKSL